MKLRTCVSPDGTFMVGRHAPFFKVKNLRENDSRDYLGALPDGASVSNDRNFPVGDVDEPRADIVYEIHNPLPFRGTTYINSAWADRTADHTGKISIPKAPELSLTERVAGWLEAAGGMGNAADLIPLLPRPLLLALASASTDPDELTRIADLSCRFVYREGQGAPAGLGFRERDDGTVEAEIHDHALFDSVANNRFLPDEWKEVMVLRPGAQGASEITADWRTDHSGSHVFEYLRRNSYIPWGHYAANTANDTVRYRVNDLSADDMTGMRHLYYQRIYQSTAADLGIACPDGRRRMTNEDLEILRCDISKALAEGKGACLELNGALWGWNFGYGYAQSGYRLHASHQQIHQQYARIPRRVDLSTGGSMASYACGDMVGEFVKAYRLETGKSFFQSYLSAIRRNVRLDGNSEGPKDLVVAEDANVILFVPKAQTSQWELQLMPLRTCGNILEADTEMRASIDRCILMALQVLETMGASMVTSIEYSKRFDDADNDQQFLYAFLPRLPESPGAFSEAQLRWINGHYPEDFAARCRQMLKETSSAVSG